MPAFETTRRVAFTPNLRRHVAVDRVEVDGTTLRQALDAAFARYPQARSYIVDDQGRIRRHVMIFVDGEQVRDGDGQSDSIGPASKIFVMQSLTGG